MTNPFELERKKQWRHIADVAALRHRDAHRKDDLPLADSLRRMYNFAVECSRRTADVPVVPENKVFIDMLAFTSYTEYDIVESQRLLVRDVFVADHRISPDRVMEIRTGKPQKHKRKKTPEMREHLRKERNEKMRRIANRGYVSDDPEYDTDWLRKGH